MVAWRCLLLLGLVIGVSLALANLTVGAARAEVPWHSIFPRPRPPNLVPVVPPRTERRTPATDEAVAQALGLGGRAARVQEALTPSRDQGLGASQGLGLISSLRPRPRPPAAAARFAAARRQGASTSTRARPPRGADGPVERGICGLRALEGRRLPAITSTTRGCGVAEPVRLTSVHGIPLSRGARMDCELARAVAQWVDDAMLPAVGRRGGGVAEITVIGEYACRTRNNRPGARISEHGRGMAIDIAGYTLANGDRVTVLDDWRRRPHRSDLHDMYEQACGIFNTTLSPDSDRHHQDHFHFDLARHRGGGTYCR